MSNKLSRWIRRQGLPKDHTFTISTRGDAISTGGETVIDATGDSAANTQGQADAMTRKEAGPIDENPDPLRKRFFDLRRKALIVRLVRWFWHRRPGRPLTAEEIAEKARIAELKELHATLTEEARTVERLMVQTLTRLGLFYVYKRSERGFMTPKKKEIRFNHISLEKDAIHLRVDTRPRYLPPDVNLMYLADEATIFNLAMSLGKEVEARYSDEFGFWYIVSRSSGVRGIPNHVMLSEMLKGFPASADGLALPLGMAINGKPIYRSLTTMYSLLVGGTIGAGKSNILNVFICALIRRNTAERLWLSLVDLKGGLEFAAYEGIPHLKTDRDVTKTGIIEHREDVPYLFDWIIDEGERRMKRVKKAGVSDIGRYNHLNRKKPMPRWVLIIDEYADTRMSGDKAEIEKKLTNIAQRFRAVGIHVIACTQYPSAKVISQDIKIAMPAQLAFNCANTYGSQAIIGDGRAKGLQPVGRFIFNWQEGGIPIQAPYITSQFVKETVKGAIAGEFEDIVEGHDITPLEIMIWALEHDLGWLTRDKIYPVFRSRGLTKKELEDWLREWENQEFVIGTTIYKVNPSSGTRARRLVPVVEDDENIDD